MCQQGKLLFTFGGVDGGLNAEMTAENTKDITIDNGCRQSEGKTPDGCSCIVAHSLQAPNVFQRLGEATHLNNLTSRKMQVASTTIVAQSLPLAQHLILRSCSQLFYRRPVLHKAFPIRPALLDLCLLENNF